MSVSQPKSSYLVRPSSWNADECDTVVARSAHEAAAMWREGHPMFADERVLVWFWSQNEMKDRPGFTSFPTNKEYDDER